MGTKPRRQMKRILLALFFFFVLSNTQAAIYPKELIAKTIEKANKQIGLKPITVTATICPRSAGGAHDFYSEGDYWWPDPANPDGPYIQRDGETNPENFVAHRLAMIRFSDIVGSLASAYKLSGQKRYALAAIPHFRAWFIDPETRMNPSLLYAQAIKGKATGRGIGIIDTIHFLEVIKALEALKSQMSADDYTGCVAWFKEYTAWLTTHPYGLAERDALNNHGTCWALQVAVFASFNGNAGLVDFCRKRYMQVFILNQMATDGSFPLELKRTKPYGYSLFNLDIMATLAHVLQVWDWKMADGRGIQKGIQYLLPFIQNKSAWTYPADVMYFDQWPIAQSCLFFAGIHGDTAAMNTWKKLDHFPTNQEVVRNAPIRNPILWHSYSNL
jgi:hypothetical protein